MKPCLFLIPVLAFGQFAPDITTNIQLENLVFYIDQSGDATRIATLPSITPVVPNLFALRRYLILADVSSVGGRPAAGTFLAHGVAINPSNAPDPVAGRAIVDFARNQMHHFVLEIMTPDKAQVGALYGYWLGAGVSAPGSPAGFGVAAVTGGSGAYVGLLGQGANVGATNLRVASMMEDPAFRRANGGGRLNLGFNLSGGVLPEVTGVFHGADFTPVTASSPARAGETLVLQVKAGWPVRPALEAGKAFSQDPIQVVPIPVEAAVNNLSADVVNAVGWPGTPDRFRVDVLVPSGLPPGAAKLRITGAYLSGAEFSLPVR